MPFYEYEYIVKNLIDILKEKQEAEEKHHKEIGDVNNPGDAMKSASKHLPPGMRNMTSGNGMPKMPNIGSMGSMANFPGIPSSLKI